MCTTRFACGTVLFLVLVVAFATLSTQGAQAQVPDREWHTIGRDGANSKYSPLHQITADNFTELEIAWTWDSISRAVTAEREELRPSPLMATPLMANGLVYLTSEFGQAVALDA